MMAVILRTRQVIVKVRTLTSPSGKASIRVLEWPLMKAEGRGAVVSTSGPRQFRTRLLPVLLFFAAHSFLFPGLPADARELKEKRISREASHLQLVSTDRFMGSLAIRPGMTILDVGTGTGQFARRFAELLAGTGKVFATDIEESCINFLKEEARRRGLGNLFPVLVNPEGFDDFYSRQTYDLVTVFHVSIPKPTAFFARIRNYMAEDGRLVHLHYKVAAPFSQQDFAGHFPELIRELSLEPAGSIFKRGLRETTRHLILKNAGAEPGETLREALVEDFNRMLHDTNFSLDFIDGADLKQGLDFTREERDFADAQLELFTEEGVFDRNPAEMNAKESRVVARFNKLLFLQRFRKYLPTEGLFIPGISPRFMEEAGFRLLEEDHATLPFEDIDIFGVDKRTGSDKR